VSARAYRVAPRARAGGRASSRVHWDKLGRVVLVLVLFVILALYVGPVVNFVDAWKDSRAEQVALQSLREENASLRSRAVVLSDPDAAERAARRLGMVAAGERSYVVRGLHR
jgi:cell division protein FtsB